jgi:hypothetical protein
MNPGAFGLEVLGPPAHYPFVYPDLEQVQSQFMTFAYRFRYRHRDGRNPEQYVSGLRRQIEFWRAEFRSERIGLRYERGPGFVTIIDERPGLRHGRYCLDDVDAEIYLATDEGGSVARIRERLPESQRSDVTESYVTSLLDELTELRLVYREQNRYLSLAIPMRGQQVSVLNGV